jgi:hypothetical protein
MIDLRVHLRGQAVAEQSFPALPTVSDLIDVDGQLWRVAQVVYGKAVDVYAVRAADCVASELVKWGDAPPVPEPAAGQQRGLF